VHFPILSGLFYQEAGKEDLNLELRNSGKENIFCSYFNIDLPEGEFYEKPIHLKGSREYDKMSYSPRFSHGFLLLLGQHSLRGSELGYVHLEQYGWCVRGLCLCE
jgi:hypothetical protein